MVERVHAPSHAVERIAQLDAGAVEELDQPVAAHDGGGFLGRRGAVLVLHDPLAHVVEAHVVLQKEQLAAQGFEKIEDVF